VDLEPDFVYTVLNKSIYVIMFQESENLRKGVTRICESFENGVYDLNIDIKAQIDKIVVQERECRNVLKGIKEGIYKKLEEFTETDIDSEGSIIENYRWFFERERIIYANLNMFKLDRTWFKGLCWCPLSKRGEVENAITTLRQQKKVLCSMLIEIPKYTLEPPTLLPENDVIYPFHQIVQTYGVATYREINPSVFTVVTFPFLFGIMFGDVAHGLVILGFSLYIFLCKNFIKQNIRKDSMLAMAVPVRYLLLFMGIFSTFCGLIYNDFASLPLYIGNTCFSQKLKSNGSIQYIREDNCVYGLGIDPIWNLADNGMQFTNSYKMKLSVIIGVLHMTLGIALKGFNARFNKDTLGFYCEFLPQFTFLLILFGYMDIMILIKWSKDWTGKDAPSLITQMVNIFINSGDPGPTPLYGNGSGQQVLNILVLGNLHSNHIVIAVICVPWMLLMKPIIIYRRSYILSPQYIEEAHMIQPEMVKLITKYREYKWKEDKMYL